LWFPLTMAISQKGNRFWKQTQSNKLTWPTNPLSAQFASFRFAYIFFLVICWVIKIATRITFSFFHFSQELHLDGPHELCIHTGPKRSRKDDNYEPDSEVAKSRLQALPVVLGWAYYLPANVLPINWLAANHVLASAGSVLVLRRGRASISRAEALRQEHQW